MSYLKKVEAKYMGPGPDPKGDSGEAAWEEVTLATHKFVKAIKAINKDYPDFQISLKMVEAALKDIWKVTAKRSAKKAGVGG